MSLHGWPWARGATTCHLAINWRGHLVPSHQALCRSSSLRHKHKAKAGRYHQRELHRERGRLVRELAPISIGAAYCEVAADCEAMIPKSPHPPTNRWELYIDISPNDSPRAIWSAGLVAMKAMVIFTLVHSLLGRHLRILPDSHKTQIQEHIGTPEGLRKAAGLTWLEWLDRTQDTRERYRHIAGCKTKSGTRT